MEMIKIWRRPSWERSRPCRIGGYPSRLSGARVATMSARSAVSVVEGPAVQIRWREGRSRALVVYMSAFMLVLLYIAFGTGSFQFVHRAIMGSAALALGYFVAVQLANVTRLSVREGALVVEHGPLPWRG